MGLALDEPGDNDETAEHGGVTFMLAPDLTQWLGAARIAVDHYAYRGTFSVYVIGQRSTC